MILRMKKGSLAFGVLLLLVLTCLAFYSWPHYIKFKRVRAMNRARACLASGDLATASVSARQALQINPSNIEASRFMADLCELSRSVVAIDWRRRVAELQPAVSNELALVYTALRFERPPFPLAAQTLKRLEPVGQDLPEFHVLSALLDLRSDQSKEALEHFQRAARLDPSNPVHRLNSAVLELQSSEPSVSHRARAELEQLSRNNRTRALALRSLVADRLRNEDYAGAQRFSELLLQLPSFHLDDQLAHLTILQLERNAQDTTKTITVQAASASHPSNDVSPASTPLSIALPAGKFQEHLRFVQAHAATSLLQTYALCEWMAAHGLASEGLHWLDSLPRSFCDSQPVPLARANLYLVMADWGGLEMLLNSGHWGEMEFLRNAFRARAAWGQQRAEAGDARWRAAVRSASDRLGASVLLLRLSQDWGHSPEEVLWAIWRRFPRETWAITQLEQYYLGTGNTLGLNRIYDSRLELPAGSEDVTNRNDFACTSLLLGIHLPRAHAIARQLHEQKPKDLILASTYAFSLQVQGKTNEALKVFSKFEPKTLEEPAVALYYGSLLADIGETSRAKSYLSCAEHVRLSPEELQVLQRAWASTRR
jgi:cytochrome c-type biogenesis protein CcmH/NrfG